MKRSILMIVIILVALSCKAQIIAVEDFEKYPADLPEGAYVKDVNHLLDEYVGDCK